MVMSDTGRVGDRDAAAERARHVDMINAVAEIGDELHLLAGLRDHRGADLVGDGRHHDVGFPHCLDDLSLRHRFVLEVETRVEKFTHASFDEIGQAPRHHDKGSFLAHERRPFRPGGVAAAVPVSPIRAHLCEQFRSR